MRTIAFMTLVLVAGAVIVGCDQKPQTRAEDLPVITNGKDTKDSKGHKAIEASLEYPPRK